MDSLKVIAAIITAFVGCSLNVVFLEHLIKYSPGCGDFITFAQFLFISAYGFVKTSRFGTRTSTVPLRDYLLAVFLFYGGTLCGNLALGCHISMPIQMIFKSGSVLANLSLGVLLLKRSYSLSKYISVMMISIGIAMCLLISTDVNKQSSSTVQSQQEYLIWMLGIFLLVVSLFMGACLGVAQEKISLKYGKHPDEMLFYSHAMALPGFLLFASNIRVQMGKFSQSELYTIPLISVSMPIAWLFLAVNVVTQFICARSVYVLTTELSSLSVTVILTLRKFVSLVLSIIYFKNSFTYYHWLGTGLVFGGTLLFTGVIEGIYYGVVGTASVADREGDAKKKN